MVSELYCLKLKDDGCIDRSHTVVLYQNLLVLRNMNWVEVRRRKSDMNIQDIGMMIMRHDIRISEMSTNFQNGKYDVVVGKAGKEWNGICLKDGDEFIPTKIRILQLLIEAKNKG
jgi:hypothetical protein